MADIYDPGPRRQQYNQQRPRMRPVGPAIVVAFVGIFATGYGFIQLTFLSFIGLYLPPGYSIFVTFVAVTSFSYLILGIIAMYAGYGVYHLKSHAKYIGIVVNFLLIILNLFFFNFLMIGYSMVNIIGIATLLIFVSNDGEVQSSW